MTGIGAMLMALCEPTYNDKNAPRFTTRGTILIGISLFA